MGKFHANIEKKAPNLKLYSSTSDMATNKNYKSLNGNKLSLENSHQDLTIETEASVLRNESMHCLRL